MDEINAVVYDGSSVTSPKNWNNPKIGDPCYSLHTDSRNYVVIGLEGNGAGGQDHGICYQMDEVYSISGKQQSLATAEQLANTLGANDYKEPQSVCYAIEGNGARPSHQGSGYSDDGSMFTLNTIERHAVLYAIEGNVVDRVSSKNGKGWCENVSPTLNTQDKHAVCYDARGNGEGGVVPTLTGDHENRITDYTSVVIIDHSRRHNYQPLDIFPTMEAHMGTGGGNVPLVLIKGEANECKRD